MRPKVWGAVAVVAAAMVGMAAPSAAYPEAPHGVEVDGACEGQLLEAHNAARADAGRSPLREDPAFDDIARSWARKMATDRALSHNPNHQSQLRSRVPSATAYGENVVTAQSPTQAFQAWMNSTPHRENILRSTFQRVAIGCFRDARGTVWATANFVGATATIPDRRPAPFASAGDASARLRYWLLSAGPDPTRIESDTAKVLGGQLDADGLATFLAQSTAHVDTVPGVTRVYYAAFERHPDPDGLTFWIRQRHGGLGLQTIANRFVGSPEFQQRYGALTDPEFVDQVYISVLGRRADDTGRAFWTQKMREGWTRGRVLVGFSESSEYRAKTYGKVTASWAWIQLLDRAPTPTERATWEDDLVDTSDIPALMTFLVGSHGFAARAATHAY